MIIPGDNRIAGQQMELLKASSISRSEKAIDEAQELLSLYVEHKFD